MNYKTIIIEKNGPVSTIYLNRQEVHNALNDVMIRELTDCLNSLAMDDSRIIVLTGKGRSFCAGADLNWMKDIIKYSFEQNIEDSKRLAELLRLIFTHPKPIIAKVNGSAFGGGVGILAACDFAVAVNDAKFAYTEVRIGLVPSVISPYIIYRSTINKIKELFLTSDVLTAVEAKEAGLLNFAGTEAEVNSYIDTKIKTILKNSPNALKNVKELIYNNTILKGNELFDFTVKQISTLRISEEGQEGMNAFHEKRKPNWIKE